MTNSVTEENAVKLAHPISFARQDFNALWRNLEQASASDQPDRIVYCYADLNHVDLLLTQVDEVVQTIIAVLNGKRKFHRDWDR